MTYPVTGIDVSKWQKKVDWKVALQQGIAFTFIRASEGERQVDPCFEHNMIQTYELGIPRGVYHFFKPAGDPIKQAEMFSTIIKSWRFELDAVVDVETSDKLKPEAMQTALRRFIEHTERLSGRKLMIYTSPGFFNGRLGKTGFAWQRKLWVAHWTVREQPQLPNEWFGRNKS